MDNFQQRNYYKLFTGTNETDGPDKLHLGYQAETSEIVFKKDSSTYFHIPYFTTTQNLSSGQLIGSGAIPGPIPAMADRIYKKQGNYGNSTPWGTTTDIPNGTWLCSWLYSLSGETPQWFDRYYNPGKINLTNALLGSISETYSINNPIYQDVPSTIRLEPGVWYQYFHHGEKTAQELVKTFAGPLSANLRLDVQNWSANPKDESIYNNKAFISNFKNDWALTLTEPDVTDRNVLNFNNTDFIDARVSYSDTYNSENEFTINFWVYNNDWSSVPATQLVGNLNYGGYSVFYNNLKYYPFFVVPETYYGHLFYFNQEGLNFLDKSTQPIVAELTATSLSSPRQISINGEKEVLVLDVGGANSFYKMNHLGDILAVPRLSSEELYITEGEPKQFIVNKDNYSFFQTTSGLYLFDNNLTFVGVSSIPYVENTNFSIVDIDYSYNTAVKLPQGTYTTTLTAITATGTGVNAIFEIEVNSLSAITNVSIVSGGENFKLNDVLTINNSLLSASNVVVVGSPNLTLTATSVGFGGKFVYSLSGNLVYEPPCRDVKFDNSNQKWVIDNDGLLYCNSVELTSVSNCTNLAIDPESNIWVIDTNNTITKINTSTKTIIDSFKIGVSNETNSKNISFVYSYDRARNEKEWYGLLYNDADQTLYQITLNGLIKQTSDLPNNTNVELAPPTLQDKSLMRFNSYGDFTGYEWNRIFNNVLYNNNKQLQFKVAARKPIKNSPITTFGVSVPVQYLTNNTWHLITATYKNRTLSIYVDTRLRDQLVLPGNYNISYLRKNDLYIGTPTGKFANLNLETNSKALIFDGYLDNIKIYDYAITPSFLNMFVRSQFVAQDLYWSIPTTPIQYVEAVDRFFKHKAPGSKSTFFKIKIAGLGITDPNTRVTIEEAIKASVNQIKPGTSELIAIEWV